MVALRAMMGLRYADWREDLPEEQFGQDGQPVPGWRTFFADCAPPAFDQIPEHLQIAENTSVWPGRRDMPNDDAPVGAHICRAFEGLRPEDVRVVVLGQDPYPNIGRATGRAFEDGSWNTGRRPQDLAPSLKQLMLAAWATQPDHAATFRSGGWLEVVQRPEFALPVPEAHFDALAEEGVLFVNAAWTHTKPEDVSIHLKVWKPVVEHLVQRLVWNDGCGPTVFLLLGGGARDVFLRAVGRRFKQKVLNGATRLGTVYCDHPSYQGGRPYFACGNPFRRVNNALDKLGAPNLITWWPLPQAEDD